MLEHIHIFVYFSIIVAKRPLPIKAESGERSILTQDTVIYTDCT